MIASKVLPLESLLEHGTAVVLQDGPELTCPPLVDVDRNWGGRISRAIAAASFEGRTGETLSIPVPEGTALGMLILVGTHGTQRPSEFRAVGAAIAVLPLVKSAGEISVFAPVHAYEVLRGIALRSYSFDQYRKKTPGLEVVRLCGNDVPANALRSLQVETAAVHFARDLINEPANILTPLEMAARVAKAVADVGISVDILDEEKLRELGFGLHLGVGQGSANRPCAVIMRIGSGTTDPIALVGKGISFDSGGLHLKEFPGMWDLKADMGGAATAAAVMLALAQTGYTGDAVAVLALAENMVSGTAIRPGDILRSYSGRTVEIRDPDCEGRLVLADCISYAQRVLGAKTVIDIATLTYAVPIALGTRYTGLYSNAQPLADQVLAAAQASCERVWQLPIDDDFHAELKSDFADMLNWPGVKFGNGSIASAFLETFIEPGVDWVHLDIAGPSYAPGGTTFSPPGGTGVMVETLVRVLRELT